MLPRDIGRRVPWPAEIEQDFGFRILQTQPPDDRAFCTESSNGEVEHGGEAAGYTGPGES